MGRSFVAPQFMFARTDLQQNPKGAQPGDDALGMGITALDFVQQDCAVQWREKQHDCIVARWQFTHGRRAGVVGAAEHDVVGVAEHEAAEAPGGQEAEV